MAKKSTASPNPSGPTVAEGGFDASALPANPSDAIRSGSGMLNVIAPQAQTLRRPFSEPTRTPMFYNEGPGVDESVTSRRPALPEITNNDSLAGDHTDYCEDDFGTEPSRSADGSTTTNGQPIRGT